MFLGFVSALEAQCGQFSLKLGCFCELPAAYCPLVVYFWWSDFPGAELGAVMTICGLVRDRLNHKKNLRALTSSAFLALIMAYSLFTYLSFNLLVPLTYYYTNTSTTAVNTDAPESMTCLYKSGVFHSCPRHAECLSDRCAICVVVSVRH